MPDSPQSSDVIRLQDVSLEDLEAVRLLLRGGSVIDWHRLDFTDHADVDRFLTLNEFDPNSDDEMGALEDLRADAVDYLQRNFALNIPADIAEEVPARDLFLIASRRGKRQTWACVVLKVMHIAHHLAAREIAFQLPVSDDKIFRAVEIKVMNFVEQLRAAGYPISEFQWSRKPTDSMITKLLAKRSTVAASIYDRLRFRLIVPKLADLFPILTVLTRKLVPFNYVVPGESVNHLVSFKELLHSSPHLSAHEKDLQIDLSLERRLEKAAAARVNEFSGRDYKIINFVADIPIRVEHIGVEPPPGSRCHTVFVLTEFQLADKETVKTNELGQNSHDEYKARQRKKVRQRLMRGSRRATAEIAIVDGSDSNDH